MHIIIIETRDTLTVAEADANLVPVELKVRAARGESWAGITATAFRFTASNTWISPFYRITDTYSTQSSLGQPLL